MQMAKTLLKLIFSAFLTSKGNPKIPILEETEAGKKNNRDSSEGLRI
jgi:hypothetical protein